MNTSASLEWNVAELEHLIIEYDDATQDLEAANYSTFDSKLRALLYVLEEHPYATHIIEHTLPSVDFEGWYDSAKSTVKGMVGSGNLHWPVIPKERISMTLALLRYINSGKEDVPNFCSKFMYAGRHFNDCVYEFVSQLFSPFARDLRKHILRSGQAAINEQSDSSIHEPRNDDPWYRRPLGMIGIGLFVTVIGGLVVAKLAGVL